MKRGLTTNAADAAVGTRGGVMRIDHAVRLNPRRFPVGNA
jgi:hypothetical protein